VSDTWLIVGLGNPGPTYAFTRHNIGARVVDELALRAGVTLGRHKRAVAHVAEARVAGVRSVLVQPMSYMNDSGGPVKALASFYKVEPSHIVVLHDELDIPLGAIRIKVGGGDNGHNGLKSIRGALGTGEWFRVRLGIGRPEGQHDAADFVLKPFAQRVDADLLAARGADAVESLVSLGLDHTQNAFNS
jgi:PTH1 family peptidyl-tRNA hydrolase